MTHITSHRRSGKLWRSIMAAIATAAMALSPGAAAYAADADATAPATTASANLRGAWNFENTAAGDREAANNGGSSSATAQLIGDDISIIADPAGVFGNVLHFGAGASTRHGKTQRGQRHEQHLRQRRRADDGDECRGHGAPDGHHRVSGACTDHAHGRPQHRGAHGRQRFHLRRQSSVRLQRVRQFRPRYDACERRLHRTVQAGRIRLDSLPRRHDFQPVQLEDHHRSARPTAQADARLLQQPRSGRHRTEFRHR